ncbi:hypothetical protein [Oceanobacillus chungangensis]|uniref:DUF3006 domain-containing protein n=1 Tax=Oceanobacillus chungangensis TaxID=1229152 RepID=A0A3D8PHB4_9BACI|nr:hypothetical protein [Oceanobacillus chungangensis]RDW15476.1 hypothetical protein CWR45_16975 [Oceanobacillus chungangensis]
MKHKLKESKLANFLQVLFLFGALLLILIIVEYGMFGTILGTRDETEVITFGFLDRWKSDERAVILIEELDMEIVVPEHNLPGGSRVHSWFQITLKEDGIKHILIDYEKTKLENKKALQLKQRLNRLKGE